MSKKPCAKQKGMTQLYTIKTKSILLNRIQEVILKEGSKGNNLTEKKIAQLLAVSRTPVREILRHLEEEGILERKQRRGTRLRNITLREIIEIYDLRSVLEGLACRLLAQRIEGKLLKKLKKISQQYVEATKRKNTGSLERRKIDMAFHQLILSECGNEKLQKMSKTLHLQTMCFQISHKSQLEGLGIRGIRRYTLESIVEALEKRDPVEVEIAAKLHIQESKEKILNLFLGSSISPIYKDTNGAK